MADYIINSADSHVTEPPDLWEKNLPEHLKGLAPRTVEENGNRNLYVEDQFIRRMGKGGGGMEDTARATAGGYEAEARLKDLDADGVWAEVIYPTLGLFIYLAKDPELAISCCRVYNDWLHETLLTKSPRFIGTALITLNDVDDAVAEIERCAKLGYKAANLPVYPPEPYNSPAYEPVWEALERNNMIASLHVGTGQNPTHERGPGAVIINYAEVALQAERALLYIICSGVLERHPKLHVFVVEGGSSWLAALVERMDEAHKEHAHWIRDQLPMSPGDYVRRQVHVSFQHDSAALETLRVTGLESVAFGTDYPHYEGTWPHTQKELQQIFDDVGNVPGNVKRAVAGETLAKLYDMPPPPPATAAE